MNKQMQSPMQSPIKKQAEKQADVMDFFEALKNVLRGEKIYKLEWKNQKFFGCLEGDLLVLHRPDGSIHPWTISRGDMGGNDWIVL